MSAGDLLETSAISLTKGTTRTKVQIPRILRWIDKTPLRETIRERQLKFTVHCIRIPTGEPANRFVIYESMTKSSPRTGAPRTTCLNQISSHNIQTGEKFLEAGEISKMQVNTRKNKNGNNKRRFILKRRFLPLLKLTPLNG